ncbi:MAG TPA: molybdopterin cofactor-binding domain-containing protein [Bryobacteraceae bacterium]|nr:molybdopterin cofactor-binding domain-containing protein [Bryobacteraceae bacterium]
MTRVELSRRSFLGHVFSAGALVLGTPLAPREAQGADGKWQPSVYLGIEPDGTVILVAHRSEMGTGIRTVLPMVAADELEADWKRVRIEQAIGDVKYGDQSTDGSYSIREFYQPFREAGATARSMLEHAAAAKWGAPPAECRARNHRVVHEKSGRSLGFGELVSLAAQQPVPGKDAIRLKSADEFRYIGKGVPMTDLDDLCSGRGQFGIDAKMPGMVYASIERSPVLGGKLRSYDDSEARKVAGVRQTVTIDPFKPPHEFQALGGVAVIADNTWAAMQGRRKLKVEWDPGEHAIYESEAYKRSLFETAHKPQKVVRNIGDVDAEFAKGGKILEADYYVPLLAHASMEPPAAVAEFKNGKVITWANTQNPQAVQQTVANAVGIDKNDVTCHVTLLGGAFGRKSKPDYVAEAAILSKKVGKPVKVTWSREEDIRFDYYHAVAAMYMKAALGRNGRPVAWLQRSVFPPIGSTFNASETYGDAGEMTMGWVDTPFDVANLRAENGPAQHHVRIGWLRSVANIYHAFAVQSFADELAHAAGADPVEYLLGLIGAPRKIDPQPQGIKYENYGRSLGDYPIDTARLRRVVELAAERSGWGKKKPGAGHGLGIAVHRSFLTFVAVVVEVEVDKGQIRIPRVDMALDAGRVVHPDRVKAQLEGAAVFGTSIARFGEITATDGRIKQSNYGDYPVARIHEAPYETRVHIVESDALPAGVGEPGVPPMAPAITNAIFAATGQRIRELPVKNHKLA